MKRITPTLVSAVISATEAAYLTGFHNAPTISRAVSAYAPQLSLGVTAAEYLLIPSSTRRIRTWTR